MRREYSQAFHREDGSAYYYGHIHFVVPGAVYLGFAFTYVAEDCDGVCLYAGYLVSFAAFLP